jgi:hypothetical protein
MDTNTFELRQKAAASADLLQQGSHVKAIETQSSIDLSDEERWSAGVPTTKLKIKTLSRAQQKRLNRERKMKEGTWTEKKPPRKTPSSQEKGAGKSSGGVKSPHYDSSTPSSVTQ